MSVVPTGLLGEMRFLFRGLKPTVSMSVVPMALDMFQYMREMHARRIFSPRAFLMWIFYKICSRNFFNFQPFKSYFLRLMSYF